MVVNMTRSVVFKTPGKLDLRSIMTFGLNAKPNTGHPIGFFGTGLKYAIAVLCREKIPVTFYIDGQKWSVTTQESQFRDKTVTEVFLERHRKLLPPSVRKLPFTTELGKTWQLWQAFRELETNTRDENGETRIGHQEGSTLPHDMKGYTFIEVVSEEFVQEFLDRDKTFLPEGLTLREGTKDIQIFDRPSQHIYYRGIRVLDLDERERSSLTYNILRSIELTEDRTAKSKWDVQYYISQAISEHEEPEIIRKAVTSKEDTFERGLNYSWGTPSTTFLDTVAKIPEKELDPTAKTTLNQYRPTKVKASDSSDWYTDIIPAIANGRWDDVIKILDEHRNEAINAFKDARIKYQEERIDNAPTEEADQKTTLEPDENVYGHKAAGDDCPF